MTRRHRQPKIEWQEYIRRALEGTLLLPIAVFRPAETLRTQLHRTAKWMGDSDPVNRDKLSRLSVKIVETSIARESDHTYTADPSIFPYTMIIAIKDAEPERLLLGTPHMSPGLEPYAPSPERRTVAEFAPINDHHEPEDPSSIFQHLMDQDE
jgi:hypothetical protein